MHDPAISRRVRDLHDAILRGDRQRAADCAEGLAYWVSVTRPVTLPAPLPKGGA